ncbi:MAG: hypothetical protein R2864_00980 [Syntrophotaleaceae bacterium]
MMMPRIPGLALAILPALLLGACVASTRAPLFMDTGSWPLEIERIALVELSFDRRYRPPPQSELVVELRRVLKQELARKGYRLIIADRGEEITEGVRSTAELSARAPAEADAVLALHIDFLVLPATLSERNPPPEAEIAGEARLISRLETRQLWRDRGDGRGGGAAAMPVVDASSLRQEALANLVSELFVTLPGKSVDQ